MRAVGGVVAIVAWLLVFGCTGLAPSAPPPAPPPTVPPEPQLPFCEPGQKPQFRFGIGALAQALGEVMGQPMECEHPVPSGDDTHQQTTKGLAYYRKATNTPSFTNGDDHWALTAAGVVHWRGDSADPPADALAQAAGAPAATQPGSTAAPAKSPASPTAAAKPAASATAASKPTEPVLALLAGKCTPRVGFVTCEGSVKNISPLPLRNVMAVVTWLSATGAPQRSDEALIAANPIQPGQESAWSMNGTQLPGPLNFRVTFKLRETPNVLIPIRDERPG